MDFTHFWLLATTLMLIHQFQASDMSPVAEEGPLAQLAHTAHRREKRCSCENQKDKECIFFCHIGIVWVNTPSQVVPYGFGSVRLRRELQRCFCTDAQDTECFSFCSEHIQTLEENAAVKRKTEKMKSYRTALWEKETGTLSSTRPETEALHREHQLFRTEVLQVSKATHIGPFST